MVGILSKTVGFWWVFPPISLPLWLSPPFSFPSRSLSLYLRMCICVYPHSPHPHPYLSSPPLPLFFVLSFSTKTKLQPSMSEFDEAKVGRNLVGLCQKRWTSPLFNWSKFVDICRRRQIIHLQLCSNPDQNFHSVDHMLTFPNKFIYIACLNIFFNFISK